LTTNAQAALLAAATIEKGRDGAADDVLATAARMRTWLDEQDQLAPAAAAADAPRGGIEEAENAWHLAVEMIPLGDTRTIEDEAECAYRLDYLRYCVAEPNAVDDDERKLAEAELRARCQPDATLDAKAGAAA